MHGHLVLVEGKRSAEVTALLAGLGYQAPVEVREGVEGSGVSATAQELQDAHPEAPLAMFAVTVDERWTLLSDLTGDLLNALPSLTELSGKIGGRVIVLRFEPGACGLWWMDAGRLQRRVEQLSRGVSFDGERLPIEAAFGVAGRLEEEDLFTVVQSLGVDIARLNSAAKYSVSAF